MISQQRPVTGLLKFFDKFRLFRSSSSDRPTFRDKRILFVDGDMPLKAVRKILNQLHDQFDLVIIFRINSSKYPKIFKNIVQDIGCDKIYIRMIYNFRPKKETTDKYIMMAIQKYLMLGVSEIGVLSCDYDFKDVRYAIEDLNPGTDLVYRFFSPIANRPNIRKNDTEAGVEFV